MIKWVVGWRANNGIYTHHFYALAANEEDAKAVLLRYKNVNRISIRYVFPADITTQMDKKFIS